MNGRPMAGRLFVSARTFAHGDGIREEEDEEEEEEERRRWR